MAKGSKLKAMLKNQKDAEKQEQQKNAKKINNAPKAKRDEAHKVDVPQQLKEDAIVTVKDQPEEYQSQALSKKEKRLLKKQIKKIVETEKATSNDPEEQKVEEDEEDISGIEEDDEQRLDLDKLAQSGSESDDDDEEEDEEEDEDVNDEEEQKKEKEQDDEEDVALSDVEFDSDADVVPHHKLTVNNTKAMKHALERVQLPWSKHSFQEHQSVTSEKFTDEGIKDIYDDTERELAFYKQSLEAVQEARAQLKRLKVPFKRPLDYFAEMVKNDEHMDKIKGKLVQEASEKKAREDARKQRDLKKFGKQVQVATLQKRQKEKRETLDKIKSLKRKRGNNEVTGDDFNINVEDAIEDKRSDRKPNYKRAAKDSKYGYGGMKRFKRKNDADSSNDVSGYSHKKMKGKPSRPGKSKRSRRN